MTVTIRKLDSLEEEITLVDQAASRKCCLSLIMPEIGLIRGLFLFGGDVIRDRHVSYSEPPSVPCCPIQKEPSQILNLLAKI